MDYKRILSISLKAVTEMKGEDPIILDLRNMTVFTDYFLVVSGKSSIHLKALADAVLEKTEMENVTPRRIEGYQEARWILLDYGFMVIHLLTKEERDFYRIEELWHGAKIVASKPTLTSFSS